MDTGVPIEDYSAGLYVCKFFIWHVFISKRALKHFVESRKKQSLSTKYIDFIVEHIQDTLSNPSVIEYKSIYRIIFAKDYRSIGMPCLRIILDICYDNRLEICSMHFQKKL